MKDKMYKVTHYRLGVVAYRVETVIRASGAGDAKKLAVSGGGVASQPIRLFEVPVHPDYQGEVFYCVESELDEAAHEHALTRFAQTSAVTIGDGDK